MKVTLNYPDLSALCDDAECLLAVTIIAAEKIEQEYGIETHELSKSLKLVEKLVRKIGAEDYE